MESKMDIRNFVYYVCKQSILSFHTIAIACWHHIKIILPKKNLYRQGSSI